MNTFLIFDSEQTMPVIMHMLDDQTSVDAQESYIDMQESAGIKTGNLIIRKATEKELDDLYNGHYDEWAIRNLG